MSDSYHNGTQAIYPYPTKANRDTQWVGGKANSTQAQCLTPKPDRHESESEPKCGFDTPLGGADTPLTLNQELSSNKREERNEVGLSRPTSNTAAPSAKPKDLFEAS